MSSIIRIGSLWWKREETGRTRSGFKCELCLELGIAGTGFATPKGLSALEVRLLPLPPPLQANSTVRLTPKEDIPQRPIVHLLPLSLCRSDGTWYVLAPTLMIVDDRSSSQAFIAINVRVCLQLWAADVLVAKTIH